VFLEAPAVQLLVGQALLFLGSFGPEEILDFLHRFG